VRAWAKSVHRFADEADQEIWAYFQQLLEDSDLASGFSEAVDYAHMEKDRVKGDRKHPQTISLSGKPKLILWVRTDSIGDAVLAASMLPYLRAEFGDAHIIAACQEFIAEIYEACPFIDDIIAFDKNRAYQDVKYRNTLLEQLKGKGIDTAFNSTYSREPIADLLVVGSGAVNRIGFDGDCCSMQKDVKDHLNRFYTQLLPEQGGCKPELDRHKDFLNGLGITVEALSPTMWLSPKDEEFADRFFSENDLAPKKTITFFAGTQTAGRQYERYGEALVRICKENEFGVVALGGPGERGINQHNLDAMQVPGTNLCGKTTLRQAAAIVKRCRLAVGAETGLAHMACAVETPNVILLGGGHFGRFMPYSPLTSVVCLPLECFACDWQCKYEIPHCIRGVLPRVFSEAVESALASPPGRIRVFLQGESLWKPSDIQPAWQFCEHLRPSADVDIRTVEDLPLKMK
jgi:ADP-heptose:LPS heptosyltransferase